MADFRVRRLERNAGAGGRFAWGSWTIARNTTADGAIDSTFALIDHDVIETAGVDCRLIQEGDSGYENG